MEIPARLRAERTRKLPIWLSDCLESDEGNDSEASIASYVADMKENCSTDEPLLSSPKKRRTSIQRPVASAWKFSDQPSINLDASLALAAEALLPIQAATEEPQQRQEGLEEDTSYEAYAISSDDEGSSDMSTTSLGTPSMILELPKDLLARILNCLPINILLQASGVNKAFAEASETLFETQCRAKKWKPPRRPRGDQAEVRLFPWRSLFRRHACQGCGKGGEFPVRVDFSGALAFLVCRRCAMNNRERLACESLYIDLVGISGKRLITNNKKNRFCYRRSSSQTQVQRS